MNADSRLYQKVFRSRMAIDTITRDDVILEDEEPEEDEDEYFFNDEDQFEEKIIIPSPKVSIDENDIPIIVNNQVKLILFLLKSEYSI